MTERKHTQIICGIPWYQLISKHNLHEEQIRSPGLIMYSMYSSIIKVCISISAPFSHVPQLAEPNPSLTFSLFPSDGVGDTY